MGESTPLSAPADLPAGSPPANHGRTTAAWVTVTVVVIGALISSLAVVAALPWLFWAGLVVIAVGLVAGRALRMLGFGQPHVADAGTDARS
ncbi:HGxxPAAW family protein [Actinotalea sp.]|uniref:HGxxPAAW family protein n=1 Tax=Actinotalea sp. TaxID=1872145 RepID=UPI002C239DEC|nr:HGxxPAAW family protein [Actinotalea sp.]HQY33717.1 HGxxPAAW family protein [Actinotalea sp.]HRA51773.1 HGxxPAAW family protein [Actinotalea sp.]